jgi:SAM-dependent methyltransferase
MPSDYELEEFYSSFHLSENEGGVYDEVELRMQADFPAKLKLVRQFGHVSQLLDVGCGKGFFVKLCNSAGIDAEGIDVSDSAIEYGTNELTLTLHHGKIESCTTLKPSYDAITLWATIEHLREPRVTIEAAAHHLKPGGFLHVDTGIGFDWLDKLLPGNVQWYDPPQHLFVFSSKGLSSLIEQCGFRIVRHDFCFDRSFRRRVARTIRSNLIAGSFRSIASILRLTKGMKRTTRFPLGNLQSLTAQKL